MRKILNKEIGSIGIGAMIVFIAMVLVAGIAASVLVQTANRLETQAMTTGQETTDEVSTGLRVVDIEGQYAERSMSFNITTGIIWAYNNSEFPADPDDEDTFRHWYNFSRIQNMTITVAPRAGSADVDLSSTVLEISNSSTKNLLTFGNSSAFASVPSASGVFSTGSSGAAHVADGVFNLKPNEFGIIVLEDADSSISSTNPVINRGDKVMLTVNASACFWGISARTDVWGMVIPEDGAPGIFAFRTPASYTDTVYDLY